MTPIEPKEVRRRSRGLFKKQQKCQFAPFSPFQVFPPSFQQLPETLYIHFLPSKEEKKELSNHRCSIQLSEPFFKSSHLVSVRLRECKFLIKFPSRQKRKEILYKTTTHYTSLSNESTHPVRMLLHLLIELYNNKKFTRKKQKIEKDAN